MVALDRPWALALFPLALAALLLLQVYRARRREWLAGSLLLWRRVAREEPAPRAVKLVFDLAFWLQAAVLAALTLALAGPGVRWRGPAGAAVVLLLDNGPAARARGADGVPRWAALAAAARAELDRLEPHDRVQLAVSAPAPQLLGGRDGLRPADACAQLGGLSPALSGPSAEAAWDFARAAGRAAGGAGPPPVCALSARPGPPEAAGRWRTVDADRAAHNVAFCAFGSARASDPPPGARPVVEVLAQLRNFGEKEVRGQVIFEVARAGATPGEPFDRPAERQARPFTLPPGGLAAPRFSWTPAAPAPLRLRWQVAGGATPDALPEDDTIVAVPCAAEQKPRVRFRGSAPHLEDLFRLSGEATLVPDAAGPRDAAPPDLEVLAGGAPADALAPNAALLVLDPARSGFCYERSGPPLERPETHLGEADPLTRDLAEGPSGLGFPIARAARLAPAGEVKVLLRDRHGALLAGRWRLPNGRPGFVLAFAPGDDADAPRERKLEHPGLAAFLVRLLREAAGARDPYTCVAAAQLERARAMPLPLDWRPETELAGGRGAAVLDASASEPPPGAPPGVTADRWPTPARRAEPARPVGMHLAALAAALMILEFALERRARRA